jgi:hypothetical protein
MSRVGSVMARLSILDGPQYSGAATPKPGARRAGGKHDPSAAVDEEKEAAEREEHFETARYESNKLVLLALLNPRDLKGQGSALAWACVRSCNAMGGDGRGWHALDACLGPTPLGWGDSDTRLLIWSSRFFFFFLKKIIFLFFSPPRCFCLCSVLPFRLSSSFFIFFYFRCRVHGRALQG